MATMTSIIIGIMVFSGVVIAFGGAYTQTVEDYHAYNISWNSTPEANFTQFNETYGVINTNLEAMSGHLSDFTSKSVLDLSRYNDAIMAFVPIGAILLEIPGVITKSINSITIMIGFTIPSWFTSIVMLGITLMIVMRIASYFLKREEM